MKGLLERFCTDKEAQKSKDLVMRNVRVGLLFSSINQVITPIAGLLFGAASGAFAAASATSGLVAALASTPFLIASGAAATALLLSIATNYLSAHIGNSNSYDMLEINAKRTATHLARTLSAAERPTATPASTCDTRWATHIRTEQEKQRAVSPGLH
jgi:hypothetical protein